MGGYGSLLKSERALAQSLQGVLVRKKKKTGRILCLVYVRIEQRSAEAFLFKQLLMVHQLLCPLGWAHTTQ